MKCKLLRKIMILVATSVIVVSMCISVSAQENENATRIYSLQKLFSAVRVELPTDIIIIDEVLSEYDDVQNLNFEEKQALAFAIQNGYITGYPDGSIRPYDNITRGEYAVILNRCDSILKNNQIVINHPELYDDVEYWCRDAVSYCMERCYMVGYGDSFGTNDNLTVEQVNIIAGRSYYGMSDIEKYNMTVLLRSDGLNLQEVMNTAYDEQITMSINDKPNADVHFLFSAHDRGILNAKELALEDVEYYIYMFSHYLDLYGTFDYEDYPDDESKVRWISKVLQARREDFGRSIEDIMVEQYSRDYKNGLLYPEITKKIDSKVKSKSFFVTTHQNVMEYAVATIYTCKAIKGYEYFIYYEGQQEALPEGVELGKWYRRQVRLDFYTNYGSSSQTKSFNEDYSSPEAVPEYLLEKII